MSHAHTKENFMLLFGHSIPHKLFLCVVFYQGYLQYILKLFENNKTNLTMKCKLSKRRSVLQCFRNFIQNNNQLFLKRFEKVLHLEQLEVIRQKQQIKMFGNKREALNY